MRVLLLPADTEACGANRIIWPAHVLAERGYDVEVQTENASLLAFMARDRHGQYQVVKADLDGFDMVVVQRPCDRLLVDALEKVKARVVVELDDDLKAVSPSNVAYGGVHPQRSPESNWTHLDRAIRRADALVVTTPNLAARYGRSTPTSVVPNYVPEWYLKVEAEKTGNVFGWPGNVVSHPHDLQVMRGAIAQVMRATGAEFRVVGPEGAERLIPGATSTGWTDDYANEVARLDVGIAPLEDTVFNRSKSWLKPLEMAALGVPFLMSPSAEYLRLQAQFGIGWVADRPSQWKSRLAFLFKYRDELEESAEGNRWLVRKNGLTIEERATEFWQAWIS